MPNIQRWLLYIKNNFTKPNNFSRLHGKIAVVRDHHLDIFCFSMRPGGSVLIQCSHSEYVEYVLTENAASEDCATINSNVTSVKWALKCSIKDVVHAENLVFVSELDFFLAT